MAISGSDDRTVRRRNLSTGYRAAVARRRASSAACSRRFLGAALLLAAFPNNARAVILIEVIEPLTLFEVEGLTFESYSTTPDATLRIENTTAGHAGLIDLQGQVELQTDLVICALSTDNLSEKVLIEIDVGPLRGPTPGPFVELNARGAATTRDITDPALAALVSPLLFAFHLESEVIDPQSGERRSAYQLASMRQVPEPSGADLAALAGLIVLLQRSKSRRPAGARTHRATMSRTPTGEQT